MEDQHLNSYIDHFEEKFIINRPRYTRSDLIANADCERAENTCNIAKEVTIKEHVSHSVKSSPVAAMKPRHLDEKVALKDEALYANETFPGIDRSENFLFDSDIHKDKVILKARNFVEGEVVHQETIEILLTTQKNIEVDIEGEDKVKEISTKSININPENNIGIGSDRRSAGEGGTPHGVRNLAMTHKFGTESDLRMRDLKSEKNIGVGIGLKQDGGKGASTETKNLAFTPKVEKITGVGVDPRQAGVIDASTESKNLTYTPKFGTEAEMAIKNLKSETTIGVGVDPRQAGGIDASSESKNLTYTPKFGTEAELEIKNLKSSNIETGLGVDLKTIVSESNVDSCKQIPKWNYGEENKIETSTTRKLTSTNSSQSIPKGALLRRKFEFDNFDLEKLVQAKGIEISEENFEDVYYDTKFYDLILSDSWLRMRNGKWVLKLPETDNKEKLYTCNYTQVEKENEIQKALKKWPHLGTATKENKTFLEEFQLKPFAEFSSVRKTYKLPMDYMVVVEFSGFGYNVAVIEKKIEFEADICEATKNINNLANQFGFHKLSLLDLVEQAEANVY